MPNKPKLTKAQYNEALAIMRGRPGRTVDRKQNAKVKSFDQWKAHPERYDLYGVDRKKKPRSSSVPKTTEKLRKAKAKASKSKAIPKTTEKLRKAKAKAPKRKPSASQLAALKYGRLKLAAMRG